MNLNDAPEPFFIVGFSRSGTTLLASLLDRHSKVCVTPETRFCRGVQPCGQTDRRARSHEFIADRLFGYWRTPDLGLNHADFLKVFETTEPTYRNAFACALELFRQDRGSDLIGEKSPIHLLYVPTLAAWFPNARFICIIRDGRDVVPSMINAPFTHNNARRHAAEWQYQSQVAREMRDRFPGQMKLVRYENLLRDPGETLGDICRDLGLSFEDTQLVQTEESAVVPEWESQWKSGALTGIDQSKIALWRKGASPKLLGRIEPILADELHHHNYEQTGELAAGSASNAWNALLANFFKGTAYRLLRAISTQIRVLLCRCHIKEYK